MAAKMRDKLLRAQMLDMAKQWDILADEREKLLAMREKLLSEYIIAATPTEEPDPGPA